ncbi:hypothetical protein B0T26DRAFT_6878 [Lasiosphaeria miniovina]|uniref:Uncharacterized protein n=1 Tax=Lasiosphaeria miniovina TaxID=1954250 RepID=A0AA40E9D2_9PEZI|nr:uncharacterized protein B0T26DRAFT_6878 [Lasiosphaeria miniovina]KAK0733174.1 hypothetical protein B0T26DRAFT_6878 [Lasiosphaeria miniovina]
MVTTVSQLGNWQPAFKRTPFHAHFRGRQAVSKYVHLFAGAEQENVQLRKRNGQNSEPMEPQARIESLDALGVGATGAVASFGRSSAEPLSLPTRAIQQSPFTRRRHLRLRQPAVWPCLVVATSPRHHFPSLKWLSLVVCDVRPCRAGVG